MQTTEEKVDMSKALDASLVNTESCGTEYGKHDTSSSSRNDVDANDADIKIVYDKEPIAEKCVFNVNHDSCVTKFLKEVDSRAKVPSNKTTNYKKPIEQTSVAKKQERQILKGHRWVPAGKIFTSSITKVDSGSNDDITTNMNVNKLLMSVQVVRLGISPMIQPEPEGSTQG
nr:hypothetical protein [Tanacetum cinerariifolium]